MKVENLTRPGHPEDETEYHFTLDNHQLRILHAILMFSMEEESKGTRKIQINPTIPAEECLSDIGDTIASNSDNYFQAIERGPEH